MILFFVKIDLLDPWEFNACTKLLVRNESDCCTVVSWIDEIPPSKENGLGIFDILVTVNSCLYLQIVIYLRPDL